LVDSDDGDFGGVNDCKVLEVIEVVPDLGALFDSVVAAVEVSIWSEAEAKSEFEAVKL